MPQPPSSGADPFGRPIAITPAVDRHARRAVWITALCVLIGAAVVYSGKAAESRSAFVRWRAQVLEFVQGVNIYDVYYYPNPPLLPLTLYPLMALPPVAGAVAFFGLKVLLAGVSAWLCLRMVQRPDVSARDEVALWVANTAKLARKVVNPRSAPGPTLALPHAIPSWVMAAIIVLSFRPILGDLHHGNVNILIMTLVVASIAAWRKGYDVGAGLLLALAITFKVTPGLVLVYFLYKRSWRTVVATGLGMGLFLLVVPSLIIGPSFNAECLAMWWKRILSPFVANDGGGSPQEVNQSLIGVVLRLVTRQGGTDRYDVKLQDLHLLELAPRSVILGLKLTSIALVGLLAYLCRTKATRRDDPRLLGEFSLVVLMMLFISERSWKHHFVTVLLPYTYLCYRAFDARLSKGARFGVWSALLLSALLMATTSSEFGGLFAGGQGHKIAQFYGAFLWAGVVLFIATAWRVVVEGSGPSAAPPTETTAAHALAGPHLRRADASIRRENPAEST